MTQVAKHLQDTATLNNGVKMPWFGLGVYKVADGDEVINAVRAAIETGYRSIDTAAFYQNERGVGLAVKKSGVPREELFITTKVWNDDQGFEQTLKAFDKSMELLDLEYLDLYLVHWPVKGKFKETWKALEKLYRDGRVRAIGVCNFKEHHLQELLADAEIVPAVNQVELHPRLTQQPLREFCQKHNIQVEAWAPIMRGQLGDNPVLLKIAAKYGKTPAQVILRWDIQHGIVTIPKSVRPERIKENADIFDFELTAEEMAEIDALNRDERTGPDPDVFAQ
jgi:diketogulonate reductase-like aldo/keto reductase